MKENYKKILLETIHRLLKSGRKVTYADVLAEYEIEYGRVGRVGRVLVDESMHKAMSDISKVLTHNDMELVRVGSNKTGYTYSYPEGASEVIDKWLEAKSQKRKAMRIAEIIKLFAMSKGLLPESWIVDLKPHIEALNDEGIKPEKIIEFDFNDKLTNLVKVPVFFRAIQTQRVLKIIHRAGFQRDVTIVFTPYYVKEYNHRFFCVGLCHFPDGGTMDDYVVAIDRVKDIEECVKVDYVPPKKDYSLFFSDIVGVRHEVNHETGLLMKKQHILIATQSSYTHGRIISKPLHCSQKEVARFGEGQEGMGLISIDVVPNLELTSFLLSFGNGIKILEPKMLVRRIVSAARNIMLLYGEGDNKFQGLL